jgi:hypothetical protein
MNKLFVVTSSIQPREGRFTYSQTRSHFSPEERLRQTIFTVNSIRNAVPDAKIVLFDTSNDYNEYKFLFPIYFGVDYVPIKEVSGEVFETVNTHTNKSLCECLLLKTYMEQFKTEVNECDYFIKATGRYFYSYINDFFNTNNVNSIFFKKPLKFEWNDSWNYEFVDQRNLQGDNFLYQYCTVLYGCGKNHVHKLADLFEMVTYLLKQPSMTHYDIETLSYYFTRPYKDIIIETDWRVTGWDGTSGRMMHY